MQIIYRKIHTFLWLYPKQFFLFAENAAMLSIEETEIEPVYAAYIIPGSCQLEKIYKAIHTQYSISFSSEYDNKMRLMLREKGLQGPSKFRPLKLYKIYFWVYSPERGVLSGFWRYFLLFSFPLFHSSIHATSSSLNDYSIFHNIKID